MHRLLGLLRIPIAGQSERTILLVAILLMSALSGVTGLVLTQYFSVDVISSLLAFPWADCIGAGPKIGRHCFSDYTLEVIYGMQPNPWRYPVVMPWDPHQPSYNIYPAAAMVPNMAFGLLGTWLGAPRLGLLAYLFVLTIAVVTPAIWAARGARGLERIVVFVALSVAAVPAWTVIDRGNPLGFVVPIALAFLIALCRARWGVVAITVVLAALVKPQFVLLAVVLFASRQWRFGGLAVAGAATGNIAAFLLWPHDFPKTVMQSANSILGWGNSRAALFAVENVSFSKALVSPQPLISYVVLALVVVSVLALGRRIPPFMAGVLLLTTACLVPVVSHRYYLVFALPIAALVVRDPDGGPGDGIFDRTAIAFGQHRRAGVCVSLAAAFTIAQVAVPHPPIQVTWPQAGGGTMLMVGSTAIVAPLIWLVTCAVIIVSYARRPMAVV